LLSVDIPENYPAFGAGVFQTSAGVHASAIYKAHKLQDEKVKDIIYSSIPAEALGRKQEIKIDSSSGISNVLYWLAERSLNADTDAIHRVLSLAKRLDSPLNDIQINKLIVGDL
jgi:2-isopropylmalate synthase